MVGDDRAGYEERCPRSRRGVVGDGCFTAHATKFFYRVTSAEERVLDLKSASMTLRIEDGLEFDGAFSKVVKQSDKRPEGPKPNLRACCATERTYASAVLTHRLGTFTFVFPREVHHVDTAIWS